MSSPVPIPVITICNESADCLCDVHLELESVKVDLRRSLQRCSRERLRADNEISILVKKKKYLKREVINLKRRLLLSRARSPDFADAREVRKSMAYVVEAYEKKVLLLKEDKTNYAVKEFELDMEMQRNKDDFKNDLLVVDQGWISLHPNGPVITQAGLRVAKIDHPSTWRYDLVSSKGAIIE